MLPKINRLKNTKEIDSVFKLGKGIKEGSLYLKFKENNASVTKFAFIVSRKVAQKSIDRNQIKRRLRGAIRKIIPQIKIGIDAVIVAQKGALDKNYQEIEKTLQSIIKKLNSLK